MLGLTVGHYERILSIHFTDASVGGITLVVIGTWFVVYEVVKRFLGYSHKVIDVRTDGSGVVEKTADFKKWEIKRAFWMLAGLALITLGRGLQIYGAIIASPNAPPADMRQRATAEPRR